MKNFIFLTLLSLLLPATVYATQKHRVTICHATGSSGNPYIKITVDDDAVNGQGNSDHNRSGHQNGEDIIPPGSWDTDGRNWTTGQAIWHNNCNLPSPTPTLTIVPSIVPTATPTASPSATPTPTIGVTPTPEVTSTLVPTATPSVTVTPKPTNKPCGNECKAKEVLKTPITAPQCAEEAISQSVPNPHVYRKGDLARIVWFNDYSDRRVAIYYGINGKGEQHAVIVSNTGEFTIAGLGTKDFTFWVQYLNSCNSGPKSNAIVDGATDGWILFR